MKRLPLARRLEFWGYQHAALTFDDAAKIAVYLLDHREFPLKYPLVVSLYVLYGRPFKQRKNVRIPEGLVPSEYMEEHRFLVALRDKLFAHVDVEGLPEDGIEHLAKMVLRIEGGKAVAGMASLLPIGFQFERIKGLCDSLHQACSEKAEKILLAAMDRAPPPANLTYEVDLGPGDRYLIKQAEWKKGSIVRKMP
jgi:hypothetical protein